MFVEDLSNEKIVEAMQALNCDTFETHFENIEPYILFENSKNAGPAYLASDFAIVDISKRISTATKNKAKAFWFRFMRLNVQDCNKFLDLYDDYRSKYGDEMATAGTIVGLEYYM